MPILGTIEALKRQSNLKRPSNPAELELSRPSKKKRNSIWVTKDRMNKHLNFEKDSESLRELKTILRKTQNSMDKGKPLIQSGKEIVELVKSNNNNSIFTTSEGIIVHRQLNLLQNQIEESISGRNTASNLSQTLSRNLPSTMGALELLDLRGSEQTFIPGTGGDKRVIFSLGLIFCYPLNNLTVCNK